jgi:hypothetical protein
VVVKEAVLYVVLPVLVMEQWTEAVQLVMIMKHMDMPMVLMLDVSTQSTILSSHGFFLLMGLACAVIGFLGSRRNGGVFGIFFLNGGKSFASFY